MKNKRVSSLVLAALLVGTGCGTGDDDDDDSGGPNPGTGSGTLLVTADVEAANTVENAQSEAQFATDFNVTVSRGGQAVLGATVVISSSLGPLTLNEGATPGLYVGTLSGYPASFQLDASEGGDFVANVQLTGPTLYSFVTPTAGASHAAGQDLLVSWEPFGASEATIETSELTQTGIPDTGTYSVPGGVLGGDPGEIATDNVELRRSERLPLAGGVAGSEIIVTVENDVSFLIDAT